MKSISISIFVALIVLVMGLYLFSFQVREIECALVTTFGKATEEDVIKQPGWYFRWPAPIQRVYKFDSRMRVFEADLGETPTRGAWPIIVNTYVVWKIGDPLDFFNANERGQIKEAKKKLLSQIEDTQNTVIGQHAFSEFVNSNPNGMKFADIERDMFTAVQEAVADAKYGVEIKALGMKQLKISADLSKDVFERMRAERNGRAEAITSEGDAEATKIKTDTDRKTRILQAAAEARAKTIRGQGDAEAAKHYEKLEEEPELAIFLRNIEALQEILKGETTIFIRASAEPFRYLDQMPDMTLSDPNKPKEVALSESE